jgi:hypothetical protein
VLSSLVAVRGGRRSSPGRQAGIQKIRGKGTMKRLAVIVVLLVMLPMLACNFSFSTGGEPGLGTAVACRDLGDDYSPIGPTDVFAPEDDFYVSIEYSGLEEGQVISAEWFLEDESLYQVSLPLDASNAGEALSGFSLTNTEPWTVGKYHVDIYLDGEFDQTVEFRVE